ncbi:MAG: hypothetical protein J0M22_17950 [Gammaproteobacteria bacterium]|nr:hypothetical protein [Gammaproteobacteria bacterium]
MSVISTLVLSAAGQGPAIGSVDNLTGFMHVELPSLDPLKLLTLYTIVTKLEFDDEMIAMFPLVGGDEEEGPWVVSIPQEFVGALTNISDGDINDFASEWSETDELAAEDWSLEQSSFVIEILKKFSKIAVTTAQQMYLRIDL